MCMHLMDCDGQPAGPTHRGFAAHWSNDSMSVDGAHAAAMTQMAHLAAHQAGEWFKSYA